MNTTIMTQRDPRGLFHITLNRPDVKNAFNAEMIAELIEAIAQADSDDAVRVLLLSSSGNHFSAGADIGWMKSMAAMSEADNITDATELAKLMHALFNCSKPVIAKIQGAAFGGAVGLVACCDIAIASTESRFCFSEVKLGLIPAVISPYIVNAIGSRHANALFLTAEVFEAERALQMGLLHSIVAINELDSVVEKTISSLLANGPAALQKAKQLIQRIDVPSINNDIIEHTVRAIAQIRVSDEGQEGLHAFLEKRKPGWQR